MLWSDEAYFSLDGVVNKHNCVIWAFRNPHASVTQSLHSPKVCVWMALSASYKLTPFFFDDSVNSENYRAMLSEHMIPHLQSKRKMTSVVFQHDGRHPTTRRRQENSYPRTFPKTGLSANPDNPDNPGLHGLLTSPHSIIGFGEC